MAMRIRQLLLAASLLLAFFVSSECQATPHARDGFYLSLNTGLGATFYWSTAYDPFDDLPAEIRNRQSGIIATGSLLVGLPVRPGFVLGVGGLTSAALLSTPHRTKNGQQIWREDSGGPYVKFLGMAGPFVDYYPSAALGWHVQALVGYSALYPGENSMDAPGGIGLMAGIGHDWWVSDRWSLGILAHLVYASMHVTGEPHVGSPGGTYTEHDTVLSPSVEGSVTWH